MSIGIPANYIVNTGLLRLKLVRVHSNNKPSVIESNNQAIIKNTIEKLRENTPKINVGDKLYNPLRRVIQLRKRSK